MNRALSLVVILGGLLGYANGANDVSKGIATLVGSGVTSYRRAILWGTVWTLAGALLAALVATQMVATFGAGLLANGIRPSLSDAVATLLGASLWVLLATRTGLPVSTTHALVGALSGVALSTYGVHGMRWGALGGKYALPLLLSPVAAFLIVRAALAMWRGTGKTEEAAADCLCVSASVADPSPAAAGAASFSSSGLSPVRLNLVTGTQGECIVEQPQAFRVSLDHLHWVTSGATSFARGLNDAPKIVALLLAAAAAGMPTGLSVRWLFPLVAVAMAAGALVSGLRVTAVLAEKVTTMNHREGLFSNLVTSLLVGAGATLGLPMSTTHVSSGGIAAIASARGSANSAVIRAIALAWLVTLPAAALLAALGRLALGAV